MNIDDIFEAIRKYGKLNENMGYYSDYEPKYTNYYKQADKLFNKIIDELEKLSLTNRD